jgi:ribonucleotide reductase alpha subunit
MCIDFYERPTYYDEDGSTRVTMGPLIVDRIEDPGFYGDTFCFHEPESQMGIFNGFLAGNCTEIIEYTSSSQTAVCNLGSIALNKMVRTASSASGQVGTSALIETATFDFDELQRITRILVRNLNRIIDINVYPIGEAEHSNKLHRPIGIGV